MITPKNWLAQQGLEVQGMSIKGVKFGKPTPPQLTSKERSEESVSLAVRKEAAIRENKLRELSKVVDFFEDRINEIPTFSGLAGRAYGTKLSLEGFLQTNPEVAAYQSSLDGSRALIARGLGDVGNLSETEQRNAVKLLPNITDNLETRRKKIENFRTLLRKKGLLSISTVTRRPDLQKDPLNLGVF